MKKLMTVLAVVLCLALLQTVVWADDNAAAYLNTYFGISFDGEVSLEEYNAALDVLFADPLSVENFTLADAVVGAIRVAGMEELALTYLNEAAGQKAAEKLADENISVDDFYVPYIACALDLDMIDDDNDFTGPVSAENAAALLCRGAEICGIGRRYIGRLSNKTILNDVREILDSTFIFDDDTLDLAGINILMNGAATGYSLKYTGYDAHFLEENTIRYGHDTPNHLMQFIALLQREGFDGYVQIEPKVSVYEYLPEWGEPPAPTATYAVREMTEGRYFAFASEMEVAIEFDTAEEKEAFHDLIEAYAKKYDDRVDADGNPKTGLLYSSWWQPLYYSLTPMKNEEFVEVVDHVIYSEDSLFVIRSIGLPKQSDAIKQAAAGIDPDLMSDEVTVYVNPAFYRYITGSDYQ